MRSDPEAIRKAREGAGHSQASLARASGVAQSHISKLESGAWPIRPTTAKKLADALDLTPGDLTRADQPVKAPTP